MAAQLRVFISHASEDSAFCQAMVDALTGAGADVWYDGRNPDSGMLRPGIMRELSARPVFLVVLSKAAFASTWVQDECEWAYNLYRRKPERLILPVAGAPYDPDDLDTLLYIESMKRIEKTGHQPYPTDEAVHRLLRALALTPAGEAPASTAPQPTESVDDLLMRGKALIAQKKYDEALPLFERAAQLAPTSADAWGYLGPILNELGRTNEAIAACDRALVLDDKQAWVWGNKGRVLDKLGYHQEALVAYDRALALDPNDAIAWYNKGCTLHELGLFQDAVAFYDRALALDPEDADVWNNKGYALLQLQRYDRAMTAVDRSLALNSDDGEIWSTKGEIFNAQGRYQDALPCLDRAIRLTPNAGEIWHDRAVALRGLGRDDEAKTAEQRARELGWQG